MKLIPILYEFAGWLFSDRPDAELDLPWGEVAIAIGIVLVLVGTFTAIIGMSRRIAASNDHQNFATKDLAMGKLRQI